MAGGCLALKMVRSRRRKKAFVDVCGTPAGSSPRPVQGSRPPPSRARRTVQVATGSLAPMLHPRARVEYTAAGAAADAEPLPGGSQAPAAAALRSPSSVQTPWPAAAAVQADCASVGSVSCNEAFHLCVSSYAVELTSTQSNQGYQELLGSCCSAAPVSGPIQWCVPRHPPVLAGSSGGARASERSDQNNRTAARQHHSSPVPGNAGWHQRQSYTSSRQLRRPQPITRFVQAGSGCAVWGCRLMARRRTALRWGGQG